MNWKRPKDDGGEPIEAYLVEKYDPETGTWLPVGKTHGNVPEMEVGCDLSILRISVKTSVKIIGNDSRSLV